MQLLRLPCPSTAGLPLRPLPARRPQHPAIADLKMPSFLRLLKRHENSFKYKGGNFLLRENSNANWIGLLALALERWVDT